MLVVVLLTSVVLGVEWTPEWSGVVLEAKVEEDSVLVVASSVAGVVEWALE